VALILAIPAIADTPSKSPASKIVASNTTPTNAHKGANAGGKNSGKGQQPATGTVGGAVPQGFDVSPNK
jgi:hypothetical protein